MRRFIAVLSALALVAVVASPVAAAKPNQFTADLTVDGVVAGGNYNGGWFVPTGGTPGVMHTLDLKNPVANPAVPNGDYPFYLKASPAHQAELMAYFAAKGWPQKYLDKIALEISGTAPFFSVRVAGGVYSLVDGFTGGKLMIDDDYVTGTFKYVGDLNGLDVQVKIKVHRA